MDRVWIFDSTNQSKDKESRIWEFIGERFIEEGYWKKVYRIMKKPSFDDLIQIKKETSIPDHLRHQHISIYNKLLKERFEIIEMLYRKTDWRTDRYNSASLHELSNRIWLYFEYAFHFIVKNQITLIVYWNPPHMGWDYIPCRVAKELNIKVLFLDQAKFHNKFFHFFDFNDFGTFQTSKVLDNTTKYPIEKKFEHEWFYMKKNRGLKRKYSIKKLLTPQKYRTRLLNIIEKNDFLRLFTELCNRKRRAQSFFRFYTEREYKKAVKKNALADAAFDRKYVYFPLHKQPERNSSIYSGRYIDQILAIERLSELIPKDWFIYVKENPVQQGAFRGELFFQRLKLIPNLVFLKKEVNTFELIRHSQFVSVVVGTAGYEAITGGKNALIFGWGAWYKSLPGVYEYHPDMSINELVEKKINHHELEEKTAALYNKCGTGLIHFGQRPGIENFNMEKNITMVTESLKQILY